MKTAVVSVKGNLRSSGQSRGISEQEPQSRVVWGGLRRALCVVHGGRIISTFECGFRGASQTRILDVRSPAQRFLLGLWGGRLLARLLLWGSRVHLIGLAGTWRARHYSKRADPQQTSAATSPEIQSASHGRNPKNLRSFDSDSSLDVGCTTGRSPHVA